MNQKLYRLLMIHDARIRRRGHIDGTLWLGGGVFVLILAPIFFFVLRIYGTELVEALLLHTRTLLRGLDPDTTTFAVARDLEMSVIEIAPLFRLWAVIIGFAFLILGISGVVAGLLLFRIRNLLQGSLNERG